MSELPEKLWMRQVELDDPADVEITDRGDPCGFEYIRADLAAERENTLMAAIEYALPVLKEAAKKSAGAEQARFVLSYAVDQYQKQIEHNEGES